MAGIAKRIMVGYDGSDAAQRALDRAAELAGYGSTVTVVSVVEGASGRGAEALARSYRLTNEARQALAERRVHARALEPVGDPADTLVRTARDEGADLLVVGQRNGGILPSALGSVSRQVVHRAPCDVLVVR